MKRKLVNNLKFYTYTLGKYVSDDSRILSILQSDAVGISKATSEVLDLTQKFVSNVHLIMEADAFLLTIPKSLVSKENILVNAWPMKEKHEYHRVQEYLLAKPFMFQFLRNSFFTDILKRKIIHLFESGIFIKILERTMANGMFEAAPPPKDDGEPRPFSLNDLQLAFISLVMGLLISFLVFIAEMVIDYCKNTVFSKLMRRFTTYITSLLKLKYLFALAAVQGILSSCKFE